MLSQFTVFHFETRARQRKVPKNKNKPKNPTAASAWKEIKTYLERTITEPINYSMMQ